jgi:hypothetical protein
LILLGLLGGELGLGALDIVRGPAVGRPDDTSVSISWTTDVPSSSRLDYSCSGVSSRVEDAAPVQRHLLVLRNLPSGALCTYRVFSDDLPVGPESPFHAPRSASESRFRFAVIGDTNGGVVPTVIAARLVAADPDLVIHTGDVVYPVGADSAYDQEIFRPFAAWLERGPILPTLGNHDAMTDRGAPLLANFVLPKPGGSSDSKRRPSTKPIRVDLRRAAQNNRGILAADRRGRKLLESFVDNPG